MNLQIKIAARHSDLARLQAYRVGDALMKAHPGLQVHYAFRASLGDQNLQDPLWKMPEKGVFTEDFVRDLHEGTADLVVHSWKDLPTEHRPGLTIAATLPRADQKDLFLYRRDRHDAVAASKTLRVLTSSPRRAFNLDSFFRAYLPFEVADVVFENVRGNIPTRMRKLLEGEADALIVAKAAVDRLMLAPEPEFEDARDVIRRTLLATRQMVLPLSLNPTAAAQGALAVEIRSDRDDLKKLLEPIHCASTFTTVVREREILASYGGGCHQKIGVTVLDRSYGRVTYLQGLTDTGQRLNKVSLDTPLPLPKCESEDALYPGPDESATFFDREAVPQAAWAKAESAKYLWIARETSWPASMKAREDAVVWTAGLKTWKALANRGIWVTGTAESLGEREGESLAAIAQGLGDSEPTWLKLTHESAAADPSDASVAGSSTRFETAATYKLVPAVQVPELKGRTHFYWMSGSAFDRAVEIFPFLLKSGLHASGPGQTHEHLKRRLIHSTPFVYLSVDQFRQAALR